MTSWFDRLVQEKHCFSVPKGRISLLVLGFSLTTTGCASVPPVPELTLCERLDREDTEWTGWSVYGEGVLGECLSQYVGKFMVVIEERGVPYTPFGPRHGQRVPHEVISIYDTQEQAQEGADFINWRNQRYQFPVEKLQVVEITSDTLRQYVTDKCAEKGTCY